MYGIGVQSIMDYTIVPAGLLIEGNLWTGQATVRTALCPKCERVGVVSVAHNGICLIVHRGRVTGNLLEGTDYCELPISSSPVGRSEHVRGETLRTHSSRENR